MRRARFFYFAFLAAAALPARAQGPAPCLAEGAALYMAGRPEQAAETFSAKDCVKAAGAQAHLNAGAVYDGLGLAEEAYGAFGRAVKAEGGRPEVQAAYGWAALRHGRAGEAEKAFRRALELAPGDSQGRLGLARALLALGRDDKAVAELEALTGDSPGFSLAWLHLARAYEARRDLDKAAKAYEHTFGNDWTFYEARLPLARLHRALENIQEAWRHYAQVLLQSPHHTEAKEAEAELGRLLSRTAEDALPRQRLEKPLPLRPAAGGPKAPRIAVGIGTGSAGGPGLKEAVALRGTGPLWLIDPATGRLIKTLPGGEDLLARPAGGGRFQLVDSRGKILARFGKSIALEPKKPARHSLLLRDIRIEKGYSWSSVRDRQLKGRLELRARGGKLYAVNLLPLEDYLYGVVTREMPRSFPPEALKAQAVIARGNALFWTRFPRHAKDGYHVCDGQHCQVYAGVAGETDEALAAADATRGLALRHKGRVAHTLFSANCGGHTQDSGELAGWTPLPYLQGRPDTREGVQFPATPWQLRLWLTGQPEVFCNIPETAGAAHFRWTRAVPAAELSARVNRIKPIGDLERVVPLKRSRSGNVNEIRFEGSKGSLTLDREQRIRSVLGLASLRSTLFIVETERGAGGRAEEFVFYGGGWGHGVGLCQHGAAGRALAGQDFRQILEHYYPGTALKAD